MTKGKIPENLNNGSERRVKKWKGRGTQDNIFSIKNIIEIVKSSKVLSKLQDVILE